MEKFTFLQYIKMRIEKHGDRPNTKPSHDLLFDMDRDMARLEACTDGRGIWTHIVGVCHACDDCVAALKAMIRCYRGYCKSHSLEAEQINFE